MAKRFIIISLSIFPLLWIAAGCEQVKTKTPLMVPCDPNLFSIQQQYYAKKIEVLPITELAMSSKDNSHKLSIYVALVDKFGCNIKSPGSFRFELYEYVPRSAEPKGKRLEFWDNINLMKIDKNQKYWKDYLRAYQFNFDISITPQPLLIEVTYLSAEGKRFSTDYILKSVLAK